PSAGETGIVRGKGTRDRRDPAGAAPRSSLPRRGSLARRAAHRAGLASLAADVLSAAGGARTHGSRLGSRPGPPRRFPRRLGAGRRDPPFSSSDREGGGQGASRAPRSPAARNHRTVARIVPARGGRLLAGGPIHGSGPPTAEGACADPVRAQVNRHRAPSR